MRAVYKKELKQFFHSMAGYVFLAIFLMLSGYYFTVGNLLGGNGDIRTFFSPMMMAVMFLIPMLTMRSFAEERKMRTDQLLMASPVSLWRVVLGKYLAVLTVFGAGLTATASCVVILAAFGQFDVMVTAGNYAGILIAASAFIAVGLFVSALTGNQVVAGVLTYSILMGLWLIGMLNGYVTNSGLRALVGALSLSNRFREFSMGIFSVTSACYYLSITALSLFLTVLFLEAGRTGWCRFLISAGTLAVGITVLLNTGAAAGARKWGWKLDMTADSLYRISDMSKEAVEDLVTPVKITVFNTREDFMPVLREMLARYELAGSRLKVQYEDPYQNPSLVDYYQRQGSPVSLNSIAVESENGLKVLEARDLFEVDTDSGAVKTMSAEQQITSSVLSVSREGKSEAEFSEGHNETPSAALLSLFEQNNFRVERKSLEVQGIGENTKLLVIAAPTRDFSREEIGMLDQFLTGGGSIMAFLPPAAGSLKNLQEFMGEWGLGVTGEAVMEKQFYTGGNPLNVVPIYGSHEINSYFAKDKVSPVLPSVQALSQIYQQKGKRSTQAVLYSSANSYRKAGEAKQGGETYGPFPLALTVQKEATEGEKPGRIFLIGSRDVYADDLMNSENYGNAAFLTQAVRWCTDAEVSIHIPAKDMAPPSIRVMAYQAMIIGAILILAVPGLILAAGAAVQLRRRHL